MDQERFRAAVRQHFGPGLERATYENVAQFAAWFHETAGPLRGPDGRYLLDGDPDRSPEAGVKVFLDAMLSADAETARQQLWVAACELWFAVFETCERDSLDGLFADLDEGGPDG